jgi:DNA-binding transcriptional ArsR family regulator
VEELAERVGMRADRLYHHLAQLEEAKLIEVAEYRRLPAGKVERVYAPAPAEPVGEDATPADVALLVNAALETTRADGVWTAVLWTVVDREDRGAGASRPPDE